MLCNVSGNAEQKMIPKFPVRILVPLSKMKSRKKIRKKIVILLAEQYQEWGWLSVVKWCKEVNQRVKRVPPSTPD
jgi:hypothetical protein